MIPMILKQLFFRSGALLLVKGLGFFIRIPLFRVLGSEGIGLYQMSYAAYGLVLTLFNGGVPTAVAILIANKSIKARFFHIFSSLFYFLRYSSGCIILLQFTYNSCIPWQPETCFSTSMSGSGDRTGSTSKFDSRIFTRA